MEHTVKNLDKWVTIETGFEECAENSDWRGGCCAKVQEDELGDLLQLRVLLLKALMMRGNLLHLKQFLALNGKDCAGDIQETVDG